MITSSGLHINNHFQRRGFLPPEDPARAFVRHPELTMLDEVGYDLPSLLHDPSFRKYAAELKIPFWPERDLSAEDWPELRLYYVRLGFLSSAYVNQVGQEKATLLPANIAAPLSRACKLLGRPSILSYDGYALYNWKRFRPEGPITLGNIDTIQNFVHLYDEHWFVLVHVEIEAIAAGIFEAMNAAGRALAAQDDALLKESLYSIGKNIWRQVDVLKRIPEKMDPALYYRTFRPYISFFENVAYEGVDDAPRNHRGETGAQSSIMPSLIAFMKIPHAKSGMTDHLSDMRNYMPPPHRRLIEQIEQWPEFRQLADKEAFNDILEAMATFREVHYGWAQRYINQRVSDPRGTGGTPYMKWLLQLIEETRAAKVS